MYGGKQMGYSKWLKTDLHIHSHASKKTKDNDYDGEDLTYEKLLEALKREKVNLFSITDHNTINIPLYTELISKQKELIDNDLNFIIGAEIDFFDDEIHNEIFHMLVYFNTYELDIISSIFTSVYAVKHIDDIDTTVKPISLGELFKASFANDLKDIITIPHFNNKTKGIPPKDQIDKFVYTVFSALEDSNNRNNLVKSINAFKNLDYRDVPIVVFSDNHNIDFYPFGKDKNADKQTIMHLLGNIEHPFNSIKSSFQDVHTRISIDGLKMRNPQSNYKHIKCVNIGLDLVPLSEYQNTIIGGFGTGKSFLLNMILNGKDHVDKERYADLASKYENFSIVFSDGTTRGSLYELSEEVKIIKFDQYKDIYFKSILLEIDKQLLEQNLHIEFPEQEVILRLDENILKDCFSNLKSNIENTPSITDVINYEAINCREQKAYSFKLESLNEIYEEPQYLEDLEKNLELEIKREVLGNYIYTKIEKENISTAKNIIELKNCAYKELSVKIQKIAESLSKKMNLINEEVKQTNTKISSSIEIFDAIKEDIISFNKFLMELKNSVREFEERYSKKQYDTLKNLKKEKNSYGYKLIARYYAKDEYPDYLPDIVKQNCRKKNDLFLSILSTIEKRESFTQSQSFDQRIDRFLNEYYNNFKTICYDIHDINDNSIMKKSAGEKANAIIDIIFNTIEDYSSKEIDMIVILDQPEDNLDNKGIQGKVVNRIRQMKNKNCLPQLICVTHNANISITADSENIIVAAKENDLCYYRGSGIENANFITNVCEIIEGGRDALKQRGIKFNLPMIKELEKGI